MHCTLAPTQPHAHTHERTRTPTWTHMRARTNNQRDWWARLISLVDVFKLQAKGEDKQYVGKKKKERKYYVITSF